MSVSVLIVDDSKLARIILKRLVENHRPNWACVEAASASEALAALDVLPPDIALMDFNMPGVNGLELAERLRERHPSILIALVTANIQDGVIARSRELGIRFVAKPATLGGLSEFLAFASETLEGAPLK